MTVRLEILGDDGEWHEVPGITSVELHQEQPAVPPDNGTMQRLSESMQRAIQADLRRAVRRASRSPSRITLPPSI
ncbi:hypothetical protein [Streptomyces sp.]|uniref:hypothetical protein n=1 Tax=Streptomyces sp. TaxID=1931 RepID=UPI002D377035|nr:hypothetical protein [Streptomyces sp.]HZF92048.1 hypothetical protein [Streptomyces sp.]